MDAALISMGSKSSEWTYKEMIKLFDKVDLIDIKKIEVDISNKPVVVYDGKPLPHYDCIYAKGSYKYAMILRAITDVIQSYQNKVYSPFAADSYTNGHDKILTHLKLLHNHIPTPVTHIAASPESAKKILKEMDYPIIMKIPSGTQGKGVMFADSYPAASSMLDTLTTLKQPFLIQEYIETASKDLRVIVVGKDVIAAMERQGKSDDKRANIHAGGLGKSVMISEDVRRIAIKSAQIMNADICAVDILDSTLRGPLVIEVNLSPGLQGITQATGINVAERIAKFLAEKTSEMLEESDKKRNQDVMKEIESLDLKDQTCTSIVTNLSVRGSKLILPEIAYKASKITDDTEVELKICQGSIEIKKL
jgi:ribosomal protein S6--L-glutamate ligase